MMSENGNREADEAWNINGQVISKHGPIYTDIGFQCLWSNTGLIQQ